MVVKHHLKVISHQSFICEGTFFQLPNLNPVLNWLLGHVLAFSSDLFRPSFPFVQFPSIPFHNFSSRIDNHANTMSSHLDLWCFNLYFTVAIHKPSHTLGLVTKTSHTSKTSNQLSSLTVIFSFSPFSHSLGLFFNPHWPCLPSSLSCPSPRTIFGFHVPLYWPGICLVWHTRTTCPVNLPPRLTWQLLWLLSKLSFQYQLSKLFSYVSKMCQLGLVWNSCW